MYKHVYSLGKGTNVFPELRIETGAPAPLSVVILQQSALGVDVAEKNAGQVQSIADRSLIVAVVRFHLHFYGLAMFTRLKYIFFDGV